MLVTANCIKGKNFIKKEKSLGVLEENKIRVKGAMCGICGSDTAVYLGTEEYLGDSMWGHEGIGEVVEVGKSCKTFLVGDKVTTHYHPSFWEYYDVEEKDLVKVPEIEGKYILQPISCPLNTLLEISIEKLKGKKILLIGSGFMSYIFQQYFEIFGLDFQSLSSHNQTHFKNSILLENLREDSYDVIFYASTNDYYQVIQKSLRVSGLLVHYSNPKFQYQTNFFFWNWKNFTVYFPSPRADSYQEAFKSCIQYVDRLDYAKFLKEWPLSQIKDAFEFQVSPERGLTKSHIIL